MWIEKHSMQYPTTPCYNITLVWKKKKTKMSDNCAHRIYLSLHLILNINCIIWFTTKSVQCPPTHTHTCIPFVVICCNILYWNETVCLHGHSRVCRMRGKSNRKTIRIYVYIACAFTLYLCHFLHGISRDIFKS